MVDFAPGDMIKFLPCLHYYHDRCIDEWLMKNFTCPTCMEPVSTAMLDSFPGHSSSDLASISSSPAFAIGVDSKGITTKQNADKL